MSIGIRNSLHVRADVQEQRPEAEGLAVGADQPPGCFGSRPPLARQASSVGNAVKFFTDW